jgi:hypothetical protein
MNRIVQKIVAFTALTALALNACNMPGLYSDSSTPDVTQAYQTVQARLTEAASLTPAASPTSAVTAAPSVTPPVYATPTGGVPTFATSVPSTAAPTKAPNQCDLAEPGTPIDVTIPDDTQMAPGQTFTKVWRLRNSGTCTWSKNYSIAVFSGDAMNAPNSVPLPKQVEPGQSVDISVDLTAPANSGSFQGNWKLRNESGTWFGIGPGGSSPFWVRIVVAAGTLTVTPPTATPGTTTPGTPTVTNTSAPSNPPVQVSGRVTLAANDSLDLDTNQLNGGGGDVALQPNPQGILNLVTLGSAGMIGFGGTLPTYATCMAANPGAASTRASNLPNGAYICYRTEQGLHGWMQVINFNDEAGTLVVETNTWTNP